MSKRTMSSYTNGTSALKMAHQADQSVGATIIAFPGLRKPSNISLSAARISAEIAEDSKWSRIKNVLESSEMFCSLRYESMLGCPYHLFSRKNIALLSAGATAIGVVSLILGA